MKTPGNGADDGPDPFSDRIFLDDAPLPIAAAYDATSFSAMDGVPDAVASHVPNLGEDVIREASRAAQSQPPITEADDKPLRGATRDPMLPAWDIELWRSPAGKAYCTAPVGNHFENFEIRSHAFKTWARFKVDLHAARQVSAEQLEKFVGMSEARAIHAEGSPCHPVYLRVGEHRGRIYVDLCDDTWRAVEISPAADERDIHWRVVESVDVPVKFERKSGMKPLPVPVEGGDISDLRAFVNIASDDDFRLVVGWLLCALRPRGPYPVLVLGGEQGSGKSNALRLLRRLIDPTLAPERAAPQSERDLFVAAVNNWVLSYDNLSSVPDWLSDALCRVATAGGFASRSLHTDSEETVLAASRPILINGIPDLARRADLADRAIVVALPPLGERRRTEEEFWRDLEEAAPAILGSLFQLLAFALRHASELPVPTLRMADAARWMEAAGMGAGWPADAIVKAWAGNRREAIEAVVESDAVAGAIIRLLASEPTYSGTAGALLDRLDDLVSESVRRSRHWPSAPNALSSRVMRLAPALRAMGYEIEKGKGGGDSKRYIRLSRPNP